jgi:hypothetical protein
MESASPASSRRASGTASRRLIGGFDRLRPG